MKDFIFPSALILLFNACGQPEERAAELEEDNGPESPGHLRIFMTAARYQGDLQAAGGGRSGLEGADKFDNKGSREILGGPSG